MAYIGKDGTDNIHIAGVDIASGVARVAGKRDLYLKLLLKFANDPFTENGYEDFYEKNEDGKEELLKYIHTVKGVLGNLSLTDLYNYTVELETKYKNDAAGADEFTEWAKYVKTIKEDIIDNVILV